MSKTEKKNILVHTCCAPCCTYVFQYLTDNNFIPHGFFYNPNIHPLDEYQTRLEELISFSEIKKYPPILKEDSVDTWFERVKGLEDCQEGGKRCKICYKIRLEETAKYACKSGFDTFTTVLTVSPHKNAEIINKIGIELAKKYNLSFLQANFKKNNGFQKSTELSRKYKMYRQSYCGCIYSID